MKKARKAMRKANKARKNAYESASLDSLSTSIGSELVPSLNGVLDMTASE